jgi:hypothetical protein
MAHESRRVAYYFHGQVLVRDPFFSALTLSLRLCGCGEP